MTLRELPREALNVPLSLVDAPELPSRAQMDEHKLDELTASVAKHGVLQRLIVVRVDGRYEVVAGHRRYMAATRAGLAVVPVDCFASKDTALEAAKYAENRFREDLSPAEEAIWFGELLERDYANDIEALAAGIGEKLHYVDSRLQLLAGGADVLRALMDKKITIGVAQELNKISADDYRAHYLHHAVQSGATIATVAGWVTEWKNLYGDHGERAPAPVEAAPAVVASPFDPMRCYVCRQSDPRYIPEQVSIHTHCKLAILDRLIGSYHGES